MLTVAEHAEATDTGRQRNANEDAYFARAPVFAVADGMGGAQAGEVASDIAVRALEKITGADEPPEGRLKRIFQQANKEIHELAERDESHAGMGTTLTAAQIHGSEVSFAHVGDSRAYVLREGELKRLTKDHSLVEELRRQGRLTDAEAEEHPQRSIITRALGPEARVRVDTLTFPGRDGDVFLLCSDGLTTMVDEPEIQRILIQSRTLKSAVKRLVDAANGAGGRDNITAVAFRLGEGDAGAEEHPTLISRTAEQAGLTAERVRTAAGRFRGAPPSPPAQPRTRRRGWIVAAIVAVLVIAAAVLGARQVYFLGTDEGGRVAIFRGLPYELFLGIDLYTEQESIGVTLDSLSPERQRVVTEHKLRTHDDADDILTDIEQNEGAQPPAPLEPAQPAKPQQRRPGDRQRARG